MPPPNILEYAHDLLKKHKASKSQPPKEPAVEPSGSGESSKKEEEIEVIDDDDDDDSEGDGNDDDDDGQDQGKKKYVKKALWKTSSSRITESEEVIL